MNSQTKTAHSFARYFPILDWLPKYKRAWLRPDFIAGLTVVALLVPEGMAYAELAGVPPEFAFYAAPAGLIAYAIFGSSLQLVVAVSSAIAVMSNSTVSEFAAPGTEKFIALTAALAILVGILAVCAGVLKLGRVAQFFSESVLTGFVFGLALVIAIKQLPKMFGIEPGHGNFWERLYDFIIHLPDTNKVTLAVGLSCFLLILFIEKRFHKIPAALVGLVYGILVVSLFNLEQYGVHIIGAIPAGIAPPKIPDVTLSEWLLLIPGALGITLVGFAEMIGPARNFASKHRYEIDANQELVGFGAANFGAGLFQGFSIGSSLSKSAANDAAGAKTQMSGLIAAGLTIVVALFLTPLFHNLPEAALAAIVIAAVLGMMKVGELRRLYTLRRTDFVLALVALFGVLTFEVLPGLVIAVIASLLALVLRASKARFSILGRVPGRLEFSDVKRHVENLSMPGLLVVRPDQYIFFANAATLRQEIVSLASESEPPLKTVLLDLEETNELDVPAVDMLHELNEEFARRGIHLELSNVHGEVRDLLERSGVAAEIGAEHIHARTLEGILAHMAEQGIAERALFADALRQAKQVLDALTHNASEVEHVRLAVAAERLDLLLSEIGD